MSEASRVYAPGGEIGYEAGAGLDAGALAVMSVTLAALAGVATQAFDAGPAPVVSAPEGPVKVRLASQQEASAGADSAVYLAMQGLPLDERIVPRALDEAPLSMEGVAFAAPFEGEDEPGAAIEAAGGGFRVQLGAFSNEIDAREAWLRLLEQQPALLAEAQIGVERAQESEIYRLRAGPVADRAEAEALCRALRGGGLDCFVVGP